MYEDITYEDILERMLDRVPEDMDTREGSIIYDALAPAAVELQQMYIEFDVILQETFADTASREYLIRRAAERGITPSEASYAVLKGEFAPADLEIPIGNRFSCGDLNYAVTEYVSDGVYRLTCETAGEEGNAQFGQLIPIDWVEGLETAYLTELLIPGEDEEDTEDLRERYFASFDSQAYGGNQADYLEKTNSISGVGATKVTPVWNGGGTVLLTILDSTYGAASQTLIETVQETIDPAQDGTGAGIAPIGHVVTVQTAEETEVSISTSVTFDEGYSWSALEPTVTSLIEDYLLSLRESWADYTELTVRVSRIESIILGVAGVVDVSGTAINGDESNLVIDGYSIPVLGGVAND